ncbi:hypothetical protein BDN71DRAFT_556057 [Pleurotus eryngii]|uniref:Uncharacterized protein n=1 Tax=Pleurotus eryngii TaxID=5323 RepID=A0A9P6A1N5_PLEER|nr:hypothetical protein BDN71DRAFT_556057 [Pleurotus eryngii]
MRWISRPGDGRTFQCLLLMCGCLQDVSKSQHLEISTRSFREFYSQTTQLIIISNRALVYEPIFAWHVTEFKVMRESG